MERVVTGASCISRSFYNIRQQTVAICEPLLTEDYVVQPIVDVSPPKWHLAHTTWFFEELILKKHYPHYKEFDKDYGYLFNSYYDSIGQRVLRFDRGNMTRPGIKEIQEYRRYVDVFMSELLSKTEDEKVLVLTELGLNHEQQHQELLVMDIKYILGTNPLYPEYKKVKRESESSIFKLPFHFIPIPEGIYEVGFNGKTFAYDNEMPSHKEFIQAFSIASRLVTNEEYLNFIRAGGYTNFQYWLMEGWELVNTEKWKRPLYWVEKEGELFEYTLSGLEPLKLNVPVTHISFYEADAYARWAGKRLLTEGEWEAAAQYLNQLNTEGNFLENEYYHPVAEGEEIRMLGNAWEWTNSAYLAYPGYKREDGALGEYNGKFMINQMILKGGSCVTPQNHIRVSYRNFFHPEKRWQFSGIRLAEDYV